MISRLILQENDNSHSHIKLSIKHPMMLKQHIMGSVVCRGDTIQSSTLQGIDSIPFRILELYSNGSTIEQGKITDSTEIIVDPSLHRPCKILKPKREWASDTNELVAGLDDQVSSMIDLFTSWFNCIVRENPPLMPPLVSGLILHGKSGIGKSLLAQSFAQTSGLFYKIVKCSDLFKTRTFGIFYMLVEYDTEAAFDTLIKELHFHGPSICILEELDLIASNAASEMSMFTSTERRLFELLVHLLDERNHITETKKGIFIIGISGRLSSICPKLFISGRLIHKVLVTVSHQDQRLAILSRISADTHHLLYEPDTLLRKVAQMTHGYAGADLVSLYRHALLSLDDHVRVNESRRKLNSQEKQIDLSLFIKAIEYIKPCGIQKFAVKVPKVYFSDIFGMDDIKLRLKKSFVDPFLDSGDFDRMGIHPPRGIVLHGPTGVGKSALSFALVNEMGLSCIYVDGPKVRSKVVGDSEANIRGIFAEARANAPCIVLIDQLDMLVARRGTDTSSENTGERIVTCFLTGKRTCVFLIVTEMDGILSSRSDTNQRIILIATTNRIHCIDPAILRPGRLDDHIALSKPNENSRLHIFTGIINRMPHHLTDQDFVTLAKESDGFTGADIENACREAALSLIRDHSFSSEDIQALSISDLIKALRNI